MNWKDIQQNTNYEISDTGLVRNKITNILLNGYNKKGYREVNIKGTKFKIHRLVALHFIPNPNNYPCINHIDEIRHNNFVENLEWCTHQYNNTYGNRIEKQRKAIQIPISKYSLNNEFIEDYESVNEAGFKNNIKPQNITHCLKGRQHKAGNYIWKYK